MENKNNSRILRSYLIKEEPDAYEQAKAVIESEFQQPLHEPLPPDVDYSRIDTITIIKNRKKYLI